MPHPTSPGPAEWTVVRGGRLVQPRQPMPHAADILVKGDTIHEIGVPGMPVPVGALVIDATGNPNTGTAFALDAITHGKHVVMLNVEADITIGRHLNAQAQSAALALSPKITALNESELEINSTENFDADRPWQNYLQRLTAKR